MDCSNDSESVTTGCVSGCVITRPVPAEDLRKHPIYSPG